MKTFLQQVSEGKLSGLGRITNIFGKAASGLTDLTGEVYMGMTSSHREYYNTKHRDVQTRQMRTTNHDRPARVLSAFELELMETMHQKVTHPLFQVNVRILVKSSEAKQHIAALKSALDSYSVPPYQITQSKTLTAVYQYITSTISRSTIAVLASPFFDHSRINRACKSVPFSIEPSQ